MSQIVYFADKTVLFTAHKAADKYAEITLARKETISRAKIIDFLEFHNFISVVSPDPTKVFEHFASEFTTIKAAGGVVINERGEYLMIHRNDRWDLPKGHLEQGESLEQCAVREVCEETGIGNAQIVRPLCTTLHSYFMHGRWELKQTHWYGMQLCGSATVTPQIEEGIDQVMWCSPTQVQEHLTTSYPTIHRVMECLQQ
ncbi:MAG: NUDIX hydrolase [Alistipes sp.]